MRLRTALGRAGRVNRLPHKLMPWHTGRVSVRLVKLLVPLMLVALVSAGCLSTPANEVDLAAEDAAASASVAQTTIAVAEDGATPLGGGVCLPVGFCYGAARSGEAVFEQRIDGRLTGAHLTLTWDAATPATEELLLGIAYRSGDSYEWVFVQGSSPLVLQEDTLDIPGGSVEALYVSAYRCLGVMAYACVSPQQAFHLEGTLTTASGP